MNLFEMMGMETPIGFEEDSKKKSKKESKKGTKKAEKKSVSKQSVSKNINIANGLKICSVFYPEISLTKEDFNTDKDIVSSNLIFEKLQSMHKELTLNLWYLSKGKDEGTYNLLLNQQAPKLSDKNELKAYDKTYVIRLADFEIPLENEGIVTLALVKEAWESSYPEFKNATYVYDEKEGIIIPFLLPSEHEKFTLPLKANVFGSPYVTIDATDFQSSESKSNSANTNDEPPAEGIQKDADTDESDEGTDSGEQTENASSLKEISYKKLLATVCKKLGLQHCSITKVSDSNVLVFPSEKKDNSSHNSKVEKKYPSNATISLAFKRFEITADDFGGKQEITAEDIFNFLKEDYPEYQASRCRIDYDKKLNWICIGYMSSTKGAPVFDSEEDAQAFFIAEKEKGEQYSLCYLSSQPEKIRLEKTPVGLYRVGSKPEDNSFAYTLPKIPYKIFHEIHQIFTRVMEYTQHTNECAAQIFWNKIKKEFFLYVPEQMVSPTDVYFVRNMALEQSSSYVLVMDVHSHNTMPAFFSAQDNHDELGTRLFMVFGELDKNNFSYQLRAGCAGKFITLDFSDIFEEQDSNVIYTGLSPDAMAIVLSNIKFSY